MFASGSTSNITFNRRLTAEITQSNATANDYITKSELSSYLQTSDVYTPSDKQDPGDDGGYVVDDSVLLVRKKYVDEAISVLRQELGII
jgi:hypothetical protein